MKTLPALLATIALTATAGAVEYVTHNIKSGFAPGDREFSQELTVSPSSLVEIVANVFSTKSVVSEITITHQDGTTTLFAPTHDNSPKGMLFTGITTIKTAQAQSGWYAITYKIFSATEINAVGPTNVLVLPENSTGNFDIVLDSSTDLVNWTPFYSQTVTATTAANFYRARIVKTPTP